MTVPALAQRRAAEAAPPASGRSWRDDLVGWAFAAPFVILFGIFLAFPILASFLLSFTSFGLRDLANPVGASVVGLKNYLDLFGDEKFWKALLNTVYFVVIGVPLTLVIGLLIATALNRGVSRFRTAFRVGYYLPVITSIVAIAVVWRFLLNPDVGLINMLLGNLGIKGPAWLADPAFANALRSGRHRRCRSPASVSVRDHPHAPADDPVHDGDHHDRLPAAVRGAVRDDRRRAARRDALGHDVHVPAGLRLLPPGLRLGDRLRAVRDRRDRRLPPVQVPPVGRVREVDR
jgi:hypothetical protein